MAEYNYRQSACVEVPRSQVLVAWTEKKEPGTHCLRMLSSPRISGNLEISVKSAPLHQPLQGMPTSPI